MTAIAFHFNAPDRLDYVCRLLRKAVSGGAKVVVLGLTETLEQLDTMLWSFSAIDFVPHCHMASDARLVAASPVILAASTESVPHQDVLVNLGNLVPAGFERFERVIEIVTLDREDRQLARARWQQYVELGHVITRHDLNLKTAH